VAVERDQPAPFRKVLSHVGRSNKSASELKSGRSRGPGVGEERRRRGGPRGRTRASRPRSSRPRSRSEERGRAKKEKKCDCKVLRVMAVSDDPAAASARSSKSRGGRRAGVLTFSGPLNSPESRRARQMSSAKHTGNHTFTIIRTRLLSTHLNLKSTSKRCPRCFSESQHGTADY